MANTKDGVLGWDGEPSTLLAQAPPCAAKVSYEYDGMLLPYSMTKKGVQQTMNFVIRPDDVFIITYPKTGTTWAQYVMLLVQCGGNLSFFEGKHISKMVPFLECVDVPNCTVFSTAAEIEKAPTGADQANAIPTDTRRIVKTHAHPRWIPEGLRDNPKAKVVYVARNPKDTAVSFFHFCSLMSDYPKYASWEEFLEEFSADRVPGGSFFENVLYWWKLRDHPNVLYLTYEDMKQDPRKVVVQIAEFMGRSLSDDIIDQIVDASSFKFMKKNKETNPDEAYKEEMNLTNNKSFMRKGIVGDWRGYFSEEQNRRFDKLYKEKMAGSGLEFKFE